MTDHERELLTAAYESSLAAIGDVLIDYQLADDPDARGMFTEFMADLMTVVTDFPKWEKELEGLDP